MLPFRGPELFGIMDGNNVCWPPSGCAEEVGAEVAR